MFFSVQESINKQENILHILQYIAYIVIPDKDI